MKEKIQAMLKRKQEEELALSLKFKACQVPFIKGPMAANLNSLQIDVYELEQILK